MLKVLDHGPQRLKRVHLMHFVVLVEILHKGLFVVREILPDFQMPDRLRCFAVQSF